MNEIAEKDKAVVDVVSPIRKNLLRKLEQHRAKVKELEDMLNATESNPDIEKFIQKARDLGV